MATKPAKATPSPAEILADVRDLADRLERAQPGIVDAVEADRTRKSIRAHVVTVITTVLSDLTYLDTLVSEAHPQASKEADKAVKAAGRIQAAPASKPAASKPAAKTNGKGGNGSAKATPAAKAPKAATTTPKAVPAPAAKAAATAVAPATNPADGPSNRNYAAMKDESLVAAIDQLQNRGEAWQKVVDGGFKPQADLDKAWAIAVEKKLVKGEVPKAARRPNGNGNGHAS